MTRKLFGDFKPMLACREVPDDQLRFPLYVSPKLDGIRALTFGDRLLTRKLKKVPNIFTQELFSHEKLRGMDGELILGDPTAEDVYHKTHSAVMKRSGNPALDFYVFDMYTLGDTTFERRWEEGLRRIQAAGFTNVKFHKHTIARSLYELQRLEDDIVRQGYEGVICRAPEAPYKYGRSTAREQGMVKIKRFVDSEAVIIRVVEMMSNQNEQKTNELGQAKRSSHKAGMVPMGTAGTLVCTDVHTGMPVDIGSGFTAAMRKSLWRRRKTLPGQIVKYKYFPIGTRDRPRHPVFLGFRDPRDM